MIPLYALAALTSDFKTIKDMARTKISEGGMPHDFNKEVLRYLGGKFSSAYITMVRQGKRSNQAIHEAIKLVEQKKIFV